MLSAEELLAGSLLTYEVSVPDRFLQRNGSSDGTVRDGALAAVRLRPLTIADLQRAMRAAKEHDALVATLMVQLALVEPELTVIQVAGLPVGLVGFLLGEVNRISGIDTTEGALRDAAETPLANAAHVLAREFGWTPPQVAELTLGQILVHLQMLRNEAPA